MTKAASEIRAYGITDEDWIEHAIHADGTSLGGLVLRGHVCEFNGDVAVANQLKWPDGSIQTTAVQLPSEIDVGTF